MTYLAIWSFNSKDIKSFVSGFQNCTSNLVKVFVLFLLTSSTVNLPNSATAQTIHVDLKVVLNVGEIPDDFLNQQNSIYFKLKDYITGVLSSRDGTDVLVPVALPLYYEIKLDEYSPTEFEKLLTLIQTIQQEYMNILPSIMLTIACHHARSMHFSFVNHYDELFLHLSNYTSIIDGVSLEYIAIESDLCALQDVSQEFNIISYEKNFLLKQNHSLSGKDHVPVRVGYVVQHNQLSCRAHWENYGQIDYLVVKVRLSRPKTFIESYADFYNNMKNVLTTLKNLKTNTGSMFKTVYYSISLQQSISSPFYWFSHDNYDFHKTVQELYQELILKYTFQWSRDTSEINVIIDPVFNFKMKGINFQFKQTMMNIEPKIIQDIRRFPNGPALINDDSEILYHKGLHRYIQDLVASNFTSVYLQREVLTSFTRNKKSNATLCSVGMCQPNITLYTDFEEKDVPDKFQKWLTELGINPYVMLNVYHWKLGFGYERKADYIKRTGISNGLKNMNNMTVGCLTSFNFIDSRFNLRKKDSAHERMLNEITSNCELVLNHTNLIIAYTEFNITDAAKKFPITLMLLLDEFVIARQMFIRRFPEKNIIFQVSQHLETEDRRRWKDEAMYCTLESAWLWAAYETIITWANINNVPIIIRTRTWLWNTPVEWRELKLLPENIMALNKKFPVYVRRSLNQTRMFGDWKGDMFSCIVKSHENTYKRMQFDHGYTGITIDLGIRQTSVPLNSDEIQTILCFTLAKFHKLELVNLTMEKLILFYQAVSDIEFASRLSKNEISVEGVKLYLGISEVLSYELVDKLNDVGTFLQNLKIRVYIYIEIKNIKGMEYLIHKLNETIQIGLFIQDCVKEIELIFTKTKWQKQDKPQHDINYFDFLICQTNDQDANNSDNTVMQKYLDSHYYIKTAYHFMFPNLKDVHFRLNPVMQKDAKKTLTAMHFLADVNNYAKAYKTNFFILPAFPVEQETFIKITWWNITNYTDISNTSVYFEYEANYLNKTQWTPNMFWNKTDGNRSSENSDVILAWALSGTVLVSVTLFVLTVALAKKIRKNSIVLSDDEVKEFLEGKKNEKFATDNMSHIKIFDTSAYKLEYEMDKKCITVEKRKMLGFGQFGVVYKGMINNDVFDRREEVAVKMPQNGCTKESLLSMLSEVKVLCHVGEHVNLVRFIGCYTKEIRRGVLWIITELCVGGTLQVYLRQKQAAGSGKEILPDLIRICKEIACGMEYIAKKKVVHGDLSTRNVLLDGYNICKIGDFGLSRKLYEYQTCVKQNEGPMPWRWMAYESLESMQFSSQSDVWSYGVTVWEIFTLGDIPYPGVNWNAEFMTELRDGRRLSKPEYATEQTYDILLQCWDLDEEKRPSFSDLVVYFSILLPYGDVL